MTLKVDIFTQMTDCVVYVVTVAVPITVFTATLHFHTLLLSHLKYVEQKRKEISPKGGGPPKNL